MDCERCYCSTSRLLVSTCNWCLKYNDLISVFNYHFQCCYNWTDTHRRTSPREASRAPNTPEQKCTRPRHQRRRSGKLHHDSSTTRPISSTIPGIPGPCGEHAWTKRVSENDRCDENGENCRHDTVIDRATLQKLTCFPERYNADDQSRIIHTPILPVAATASRDATRSSGPTKTAWKPVCDKALCGGWAAKTTVEPGMLRRLECFPGARLDAEGRMQRRRGHSSGKTRRRTEVGQMLKRLDAGRIARIAVRESEDFLQVLCTSGGVAPRRHAARRDKGWLGRGQDGRDIVKCVVVKRNCRFCFRVFVTICNRFVLDIAPGLASESLGRPCGFERRFDHRV